MMMTRNTNGFTWWLEVQPLQAYWAETNGGFFWPGTAVMSNNLFQKTSAMNPSDWNNLRLVWLFCCWMIKCAWMRLISWTHFMGALGLLLRGSPWLVTYRGRGEGARPLLIPLNLSVQKYADTQLSKWMAHIQIKLLNSFQICKARNSGLPKTSRD